MIRNDAGSPTAPTGRAALPGATDKAEENGWSGCGQLQHAPPTPAGGRHVGTRPTQRVDTTHRLRDRQRGGESRDGGRPHYNEGWAAFRWPFRWPPCLTTHFWSPRRSRRSGTRWGEKEYESTSEEDGGVVGLGVGRTDWFFSSLVPFRSFSFGGWGDWEPHYSTVARMGTGIRETCKCRPSLRSSGGAAAGPFRPLHVTRYK